MQHRKFHGDKLHVVFESMFVAIVQMMEVVGEEISSVEPETLGANPILRRYSNKYFSRSKLNIKMRFRQKFSASL